MPLPHLHIQRYDPEHGGLAKLHVPTGRVLFEDVVRFLLSEQDVRALVDDWKRVLTEVSGRVKAVWSWA